MSALVFSRFVNMATTTMRHTPARPMAITARGTSTTASSWAWAHGPVGATATAGAAIGSVMTAAEAIAAAAAGQPIAAIMRAAADSLAATLPLLVPTGRVPAQVGLQAAAVVDIKAAVGVDIRVAAVADMTAAAVDTEAAKSNHL